MTVIPPLWVAEVGGSETKVGPGQKCETIPEKLTKAKRAEGVA
jgi:hypothetical protein